MSVMLVAPPRIISKKHKGTLFIEPVEHLGIECIAGACIEAGISAVTCFDCHMLGLTPQQAAEKLLEAAPEIVGISIKYEQTDLDGGKLIASLLRENGYKGLIIAGGIAATYMDEHLLSRGFDGVIRGEGELAFTQLAESYLSGSSWQQTPNLSFSNGGTVVRNKFSVIDDMNLLPKPDRQLLADWFDIQQTKGIPIETSRGCWSPCSFCVVPDFHGSKWRPKSIRKALAEIDQFYFDGISVEFVDDNFLGPPTMYRQRIDELKAALDDLNYHVKFALSCRADAATEDNLNQLKELGLERLYIGLENGSPTMLKRLAKQISVSENKRAIEVVKKADIPTNFCLIMFDPFTTVQELRENIEFIKSTGIYKQGMRPLNLLNSLLVLKGTKFYHSLNERGLLKPLGETMFTYDFQDWKVGMIQDLVSYLEQVVPGLLVQFNQIRYKYYTLVNYVSKRYNLPDTELEKIPELHYDFINQVLRWHDNLPGFIVSIYESVIDIVDQEFDETMRNGAKVAITEQVYKYMNKYMEGDLSFLTVERVKQLLEAKEITLTLPNGEVVNFDSPLLTS